MDTFWSQFKGTWLLMIELPWQNPRIDDRRLHWQQWLLGWSWTLGGLVLGALVAPQLLQFAGLSTAPYQDLLVIGVAAVAGFLVQFLGWSLVGLSLAYINNERLRPLIDAVIAMPSFVQRVVVQLYKVAVYALIFALVMLPLAGVGYGIFRYLTWVGAGQREVTIAFVGALLVKTFLIPFIKGIVTGALFKWFMNWLRGGKETKKVQ